MDHPFQTLPVQEVQLLTLLDSWEMGDPAYGALNGDPLGLLLCYDHLEELGQNMTPFEVGKCYLCMTVTLYWIGRVKELRGAFVIFEDASWVHWTGRLSELCERKEFTTQRERAPRTEIVGGLMVNIGHIAAAMPDGNAEDGERTWVLPTTSIQRDN